MKKNFFIRFLPVLLFWLSPAMVFAAEPDLIISTSVTDGAIVACGNEQNVTVKIKNNTLNSITLNGLNLFNSTTTQIQVVAPLPSGWKNTGCAAGYTYCPVSATSIIPSQTLTLIFKVKAGCSIIPAVESGQQNFFDVKVLYNTSLIGTQQSVIPVNILYPNYSLTVTPDGAVAYGEIVTRTITVCNLGNGFNPTLNLTHTHDPGVQWLSATYEIKSPANTVLSSGTATHTGSGTTDTYVITDTNPEVISDPTDQKRCYVITEKFKVTGCGQINSNYTTSWGCNSQNCKSNSKTNLLIVKNQYPQINVTEESFTKPDFCTPGKVVYQIHNYGDDPAGDIIFDLPFSSNVVLTNGKIGLDNSCGTSGISLPAPTASPYHLDVSALTALVNPTFGTSLINGRLFLNSRSVIYICFDVAYTCPSAGGSAIYTIGPGSVNYKDVCGTSKPPAVLDQNESKISWSTCGARFTPDMKVGDIQKLKICYEASTSQIPCANGQYTATYTLPQGLSYQAGTALIDGTAYSNVSVNGNIVTFNGIGNYQGLKCFEISVKLTCDGTSAGSSIIKEFLSTFKLKYKCDKNSTCCDITAGDYSFKVFGDMTTCPNVTSPNCLQTTSCTLKRNTFGINPLTNLPATASTAGIALDRAYPCDEVLACAKGKWTSTGATLLPANTFINVEFEQPASIMQFLSGTIEIVDAAGNLITSCAAATPVTTVNGTKYTQRFTVPCGTTINPNYGVNLCAKYKVLDNPSIGNGPILSVFRVTFGYKNGGTDITCLGKGDQMTLIRPIHSLKVTTFPGVAKPQCDPWKVIYTWTTETCFGDDFPNEIRNINQFANYKFNYPTGYNLLDANYINVTCNGSTTTPIKGLPPGSINCAHPFALLPAFPSVDKCSNSIQQRLEFNLQPTCLAPESGSISMDLTYKNFPGTACEKLETKSITAPLNNNQPKLIVSALPPSIDATTDYACWTIRVYNASYDVFANQVFLKFPTCSGITVASISDITNGNWTDLTPNFSNGQLPIGSFSGKNEKIYEVCGTYKCTNNACPVEVSSTCGVPYYCTNTTIPQVCTASQTTISAIPKEGLLQTQFEVPTEITDVCEDITMSYVISNVGTGALYDVITKITSFPTCWTIVPGSVCIVSTRPNSRPICLPDFNLLTGLDLSGFEPGDWGLRVSFKVKTTCDLLNCTAATIVMQTTAKKGCGDIITNTFTSKNLLFNSKPDYSYTPTITAEPFTYCSSTDVPASGSNPAKNGISTVTFSLAVNGPFTNTAGDLIAINIPAGFQYVANSFTPQSTVGGVTLVSTAGVCSNAQTVKLKINNAVAIGGIIKFTMNVTRCNPDLSCGSYPFSCSITQNDTRTCTSPVLNCVIGDGKVTNDYPFFIDVKKPTFAVSNVIEVSPLGLCSANGQIRFTLTNTGGLALNTTDQVPVDIYCSTGCPSIVCGSSLPAGVTLLKTVYVTPGATISTVVTTSITGMCKPGTNLFFRVGGTCSPVICFCPTTYCHTLVRPTVDFTVTNNCKGSNACIVNNSNSLGQAATYVVKLKSGTTTLYTFPSCTAANCGTNSFCITPAQLNLAAGNYTWEVTQTTACGSITVTKPYTVYPLPTVTVSPAAVSICPGTPTPLTAGGAATYTWSPTPTNGIPAGTTVSVNPTVTTTYTVTGVSTFGCQSTTTVKVTVNSVPTVNVANFELCPGACGLPNFAAGISGGTPFVSGTNNYYQYSVTGPNGFVFNCNTLPYSVSGNSCAISTPFCTPGTYTVSAWGSNNCKGIGTFNVSVLNMPVLTATNKQICAGRCVDVSTLIGYNPANLTSGESITVVNNTTGATVLSCTQPGCSFQLCPTATTTYTATFKKVSVSGKTCLKSVTFTITIGSCCDYVLGTLKSSVPAQIGWTYNEVPPVTVCIATPLTIDWSANSYPGAVSVQIDQIYAPLARYIDSNPVPGTSQTRTFANCLAVNLKSFYTFQPNYWYRVIITASTNVNSCQEGGFPSSLYMYVKVNDCVNCSESFTANVNGAPAELVIAPTPKSQSVTVTPSGGTTPYTYSWTYSSLGVWQGAITTSNPTSNPTTLNATGNAGGNIQVWVKDSKGCIAANYRGVQCSVTAFTNEPENDVKSTIQEAEKEGTLHVMPNPNNGSFTIVVDLETEKDVFIYDMTGKIVFEKIKTKDQSFNIDISHLVKGIYLVKVSDGKDYEIKKVVVQ